MPDLIGNSIGRYHIIEKLGEGGMAIVYKARDTVLDRNVAVKVIRTDQFGSALLERILERFEREAKALAKLNHPNIVAILDYGEIKGAPYFVMPYLPGKTLKQKLTGPMPYREAVNLILPILKAMDHAHQLGIIHRDIKPANILLTQTGEPMLSDFGIPKVLDTEVTHDLTATGMGIGTPEYMAPEQGMGKADERSDIYSLGIVVYEMLTGRVPFRADTPMAILLKKTQEPLPRPKQFVPGMPGSVENILIKALSRDPAYRYQTIHEFLIALKNLSTVAPIAEEHERQKPANSFLWPAVGLGVIALITLCGLGIFFGLKFLPSFLTTKTPNPAETKITLISTITTTKPTPNQVILTKLPTLTEFPVPTLTLVPISPQPEINSQDHAVLIYIPAASFEMGLSKEQADYISSKCNRCTEELAASQPRHTVTLDAFWIYKTEVSNGMYQLCVQAGNCSPPSKYSSELRSSYYNNPDYANYPVNYVSWNAAEQYCQWTGGHLPTEAQWEYAARGPDGNLFPWGNQWPTPSLANLAGYISDTQPVDSYLDGSSYFNLLNMSGNVWEWVFDWYKDDYYQTNTGWTNPTGPTSGKIRNGGSLKAGRGGSYWVAPGWSSVGIRDAYQAELSGSAVGFRCAKSNP